MAAAPEVGAAGLAPAGDAPRWVVVPWTRRVLDTVSAYLPLLLMALLALGTMVAGEERAALRARPHGGRAEP